jgi:hypothetical protein
MWQTFENVSGKDLDWFWQGWYDTTWNLDHSSTSGSGNTITIADKGDLAMPVVVTITRANGEQLTREVPVDTWLKGATTATVTAMVAVSESPGKRRLASATVATSSTG